MYPWYSSRLGRRIPCSHPLVSAASLSWDKPTTNVTLLPSMLHPELGVGGEVDPAIPEIQRHPELADPGRALVQIGSLNQYTVIVSPSISPLSSTGGVVSVALFASLPAGRCRKIRRSIRLRRRLTLGHPTRPAASPACRMLRRLWD